MAKYFAKYRRMVDAVQIIENDGETTLNEFPDWIVESLAEEREKYIFGFRFCEKKPYVSFVSCDELLTLPVGTYIYLDPWGSIGYLDEKTFESIYEKA